MLATKLKQSLFLFILLQPFLDIFWLYQPPLDRVLLGMSPATIIRIGFVGVIGVMYLVSLKTKRELWYYTGYLLVLGGYFLLHQRNAGLFHALVPGNFGYSTFGELFYLVRMLMPLFMIVVAARTQYTDHQFERLINWLTIFFSGSIVLTNILGISLGSYLHQWGKGDIFQQYGRQKITGTILNWFGSNQSIDFYGFASKGFFNHANTTGTILVLLTPLVLYVMITHFNWQNIVLTVIHGLACIELGTKVAGYGVIGILVVYVGLYLFFVFVMKELTFRPVILVTLVLILVGAAGLNQVSPTASRQLSEDESSIQLKKSTKNKTKNLEARLKRVTKEGTKTQQIRFIMKYRRAFGLNENFVTKAYPAKYDPQFWLDVMRWPTYSRMNYRYLQTRIWKRVVSINNNPKDKWWGFGYTRLSNMGLIERDFVSQYYALGMVGLVLVVAPYLGLLALLALAIVMAFKKRATFKTISLFAGCALMLMVALYAGYVLDYLTATLILGFFMGQLVQAVWPKTTQALRE